MQKGSGERDTECHIQPTLFGLSPLLLSGGYVRRYLHRHVHCPHIVPTETRTSYYSDDTSEDFGSDAIGQSARPYVPLWAA